MRLLLFIMLLMPSLAAAQAPRDTVRVEAPASWTPRFDTLSVGQRLVFVNDSDLLHTWRVVAVERQVEGETWRRETNMRPVMLAKGQSIEYRFEEPGFYLIACDKHPSTMSAGYTVLP